jgi:hypothetical protein
MDPDALEKFGFLLGSWNLDYRIPKSNFSEARSDRGNGSFKKILTDKYILFEYSTESGGEAKGIFAWDDKIKVFRYWWFENSGSFATATCNFINDKILAMNWHDTLLVQTFVKESPDKIVLKMQNPSGQGGYDCIMEVILTRN